MIWTFAKGGGETRCEIRRDEDGVDYEFVLTGEDGSERVERFRDPTELIERSVSCFKDLFEQGWRAK